MDILKKLQEELNIKASQVENTVKLLDEGNEFCALFTDLSNPASNGAYMKVGYQAIGDCTQLKYHQA